MQAYTARYIEGGFLHCLLIYGHSPKLDTLSLLSKCKKKGKFKTRNQTNLNNSANGYQQPSSYTDTINLLTRRHLSWLSLLDTLLLKLFTPDLKTNFIENCLLLTVGGSALFATTLPWLDRLYKTSVVALNFVTLQIMRVILFSKYERAVLGIAPTSTWIRNAWSAN